MGTEDRGPAFRQRLRQPLESVKRQVKAQCLALGKRIGNVRAMDGSRLQVTITSIASRSLRPGRLVFFLYAVATVFSLSMTRCAVSPAEAERWDLGGMFAGRAEPLSHLLPPPMMQLRNRRPLPPFDDTWWQWKLQKQCNCRYPRTYPFDASELNVNRTSNARTPYVPPNFTITSRFIGNPDRKRRQVPCCRRVVFRMHKHGYMLGKFFFSEMPDVELAEQLKGFPAVNNLEMLRALESDFRIIFIHRNIYAALGSGYLYHKNGNECWLTENGLPHPHNFTAFNLRMNWYDSWKFTWNDWISYVPDPPMNDRSICQYLAEESEEVGMRAYIDMIFRFYYYHAFAHFALAQMVPQLGERTLSVCYEDLTNPQRDIQALNNAMDFFYGKGHHGPWTGPRQGRQKYSGGHSTSHDPLLRQRLRHLIDKIDREHYNGDIAWVHSILPCK